MKRFTIIDPKTGDPYCGLNEVPAENANLMRLVPMEGQKHWSELEVHEGTMTTAGLRVLRVA